MRLTKMFHKNHTHKKITTKIRLTKMFHKNETHKKMFQKNRSTFWMLFFVVILYRFFIDFGSLFGSKTALKSLKTASKFDVSRGTQFLSFLGRFWEPFWRHFWCHFWFIFPTPFPKASWHVFGIIFGPFRDQVGPREHGKTLRCSAIPRFRVFSLPFFFGSRFGSILGLKMEPKSDQKRYQKRVNV